MEPSVCFILCTERGFLEKKSLLFARSLRRFGGALADADIHSYAPREGWDISAATKARFDEIGVVHQYLPLNVDFTDYPQGNKPPTMAHAERELGHDILVFCDSDQLILDEPTALLDCTEETTKLRPVDLIGSGVRNERDPDFAYWQRVYEICGTDVPQWFVESTVDNQMILPYWNAGLIPFRRSAGLATLWLRNFTAILSEGLIPSLGIFFTDQTSLAATLIAAGIRVEALPNSYNYPIHLQTLITAKYRIDDLASFTTIHYHRIFEDDVTGNPLDPLLDSSTKARWIRKQLKDTNIYQPQELERGARRYGDTLRRGLRWVIGDRP